MRDLFLFLFAFLPYSLFAQPTISFTFDDGSTKDHAGFAFKEWNSMLLRKLDSVGVRSVFFVKGNNKLDEKGRYLLDSWNERGHKIANHSFSHPNFNRKTVSAADFRKELLKTDSIIRNYSEYVKLFRFPYLKEGNTPARVDSIRQIMQEQGYRNGHVTIDASDWYIDSRLKKRLYENPKANIEGFKEYYLQHHYERASYYDSLAYALTNRRIKHTLLLHHNLAAALFIDELVAMFREKGWKVVSAEEAFADPIYTSQPDFAGESLIYALTKDTGKGDLRYPAEGMRYEKEKMDKLGLWKDKIKVGSSFSTYLTKDMRHTEIL